MKKICKSCGKPLKYVQELGHSKPFSGYCDNPECKEFQKEQSDTGEPEQKN